jgi:hypothetical protein
MSSAPNRRKTPQQEEVWNDQEKHKNPKLRLRGVGLVGDFGTVEQQSKVLRVFSWHTLSYEEMRAGLQVGSQEKQEDSGKTDCPDEVSPVVCGRVPCDWVR